MLKTLITIKLLILFSVLVSAQEITGDWKGVLKAGETEIGFIFTIQESESGLEGSMAIPARNLRNMKAGNTTFANGELLIDGSNNGWQYKATYNPSNQTFEGHFKEGVNMLSLNLSKGALLPEVKKKRPQEPKLPLPYLAEKVKFENKKAKIKLAGTLTLPKVSKRSPAVILISGSGPQNRDEEIFGHRPFKVLADYLTRNGIAVLRYDDRGVNESEGNYAEATTADFATDVLAAVEFLKSRNDIDKNNIGLVGHSEGGIIAPIVAVEHPEDIAFIVSLAGTGVSGYETNRLQGLHQVRNLVPNLDQYNDFLKGALDIASKEGDLESIREELSEYYLASTFFNQSVPPAADKAAILKSLVEQRTTVWARYFYKYNPADMYSKVKCPVLALFGEKDTQVFPEPNKSGLEKALENGKTESYEVMLLEGKNHLFQDAETGEMNEYNSIEETMSPQVLNLVSKWIQRQIK